MSNVTIKREIRKQLHEESNYDETVDDTINRLINEKGDISTIKPSLTGSIGINLTPETKSKLDDLKFPKESYSSVIERLLKA